MATGLNYSLIGIKPHTCHVLLFDVTSTGWILIVFGECLSENKYIYDCICSIINLCGWPDFKRCIVHYIYAMNAIVWAGQ